MYTLLSLLHNVQVVKLSTSRDSSANCCLALVCWMFYNVQTTLHVMPSTLAITHIMDIIQQFLINYCTILTSHFFEVLDFQHVQQFPNYSHIT